MTITIFYLAKNYPIPYYVKYVDFYEEMRLCSVSLKNIQPNPNYIHQAQINSSYLFL